jgi:hypothetical protein
MEFDMSRLFFLGVSSIFSLFLLVSESIPAAADPVYLTCDTDLGGNMHNRYSVTLDYQASTVKMELLPNLEPITDRQGQSTLPMQVRPLEILWERHNTGGTVVHFHIDRASGDLNGYLTDENNVLDPDIPPGPTAHCTPGAKPAPPAAKF